MDDPLDKYAEVETGEAFTIQNPRLLKVELSETTVMARNGAMVAYQGDVRFEHKGGGLSRLIKKAATGESLKLMQASGSGEMFLANQAMLVHVLRLQNDSLTVNGANILAFEAGIDWDITRVKGGAAGMLAGGLFNVGLHGTGYVALLSDGEPLRLDVAEAPTFADPAAAIAWSGGVTTNLKSDMQAKTLIGMGSGESFQLALSGQGWVLVQPSEGRFIRRRHSSGAAVDHERVAGHRDRDAGHDGGDSRRCRPHGRERPGSPARRARRAAPRRGRDRAPTGTAPQASRAATPRP